MTSLNLDTIFDASEKVAPRYAGRVMLKLVEEVGEMSKALMEPERCNEDLYGEACDSINCIMDLLWLYTQEQNPQRLDESHNAYMVRVREIVEHIMNERMKLKCEKWVTKDAKNNQG